ncbi:MAG: hypothetical protein AB7P69_20005 [Candidatus Binatia bacterium]
MLAAHRLLEEIIASLRNVIGPAIPDPYPKAQAFMAAVVLEFISRQVEERHDIAAEKDKVLSGLFSDLSTLFSGKGLPAANDLDQETRLCRLIEWLYAEKDRLGPETFNTANQHVRTALRELLDQELKIAGAKE